MYVLRADSETGQYFGGNTGRSDFVHPHVTFFMHATGNVVVADAPAGTLVEKDKTVNDEAAECARGPADGKTLTSDTMRYNDDSDTLYGDGNVVVTTPAGRAARRASTLVWNMHDRPPRRDGRPVSVSAGYGSRRIVLENLVKRYGARTVVDDVTAHVGHG